MKNGWELLVLATEPPPSPPFPSLPYLSIVLTLFHEEKLEKLFENGIKRKLTFLTPRG